MTTVTTGDYSEKIIPEPMPIVVETGTTTTTTVTRRGDSSKPISVYAQGNITHPIKSSTAIQWDNKTQTNYTNVSVSGWWILAAYAIATSGQSVPQPAGAY